MSGFQGEESIYGLIPEPFHVPPKQPLYRSKFPGNLREFAPACCNVTLARRHRAETRTVHTATHTLVNFQDYICSDMCQA